MYSSSDRGVRAVSAGYHDKAPEQIFKSRQLESAMDPRGVKFRESRDSEAHPNSVAIIIALDVTASMGKVPADLVKDGLPNMVQAIIDKGIPDPQILFLGIGDHVWDSAPLQVGQFESGDEELDKWLTETYIERGGGGNNGESYMLAWYFAARHTEIDCFDKRKQKGFLFTIGDEPVLDSIDARGLEKVMGPGQYGEIKSIDLLEEARKRYNVYHLHISETYSGARAQVQNDWKEMMGDNCVIIQSSSHVSSAISKIVSENGTSDNDTTQDNSSSDSDNKSEEIL